MNGKVLGAIIVLLVLGLGFFLIKDQVDQSTPQTSTDTPTAPTASDATPTATQAKETTVTLTSSGFSPASLTVKAGTKVNLVNKSGTSATVDSDPHPVHTSYPALNLGGFKDGETLTFTFDKAGSFGYHNHLNATQKGTVIVE